MLYSVHSYFKNAVAAAPFTLRDIKYFRSYTPEVKHVGACIATNKTPSSKAHFTTVIVMLDRKTCSSSCDNPSRILHFYAVGFNGILKRALQLRQLCHISAKNFICIDPQ